MNHPLNLQWPSFLTLFSELSADLVRAPHDRIDDTLKHTLARIGQWLHTDRCYLFRYSCKQQKWRRTHLWCAPDVEAPATEIENTMACLCTEWSKAMHDRGHVHAPAYNTLPEQSPERQLLKAQGVQSVLLVPLVTDQGVVGILGLDQIHRQKHWSEQEIAAVHLVADSVCSLFQRQKAEVKAARLTNYDPLTGLMNRTRLREYIRDNLPKNLALPSFRALLIFDIDHFKRFNDRYGYDVGDRLLLRLTEHLKHNMGPGVLLARLGDDEFAVYLDQLPSDRPAALAAVNELAKQMRRLCSDTLCVGGQGYEIRVSVGVSLRNQVPGCESDLFKEAGIAMQQAKHSGRNTVRFFEPNLQRVSDASDRFHQQLYQGITGGELVLHYQPIVNKHKQTVAAEALVRWRHPEQGLLSPAEFIPFAEQSDLIVALGREVFRLACAELRRWQHHPNLRDLQMSVNVSMKQFRDPNFVQFLTDLLKEHPGYGKKLKLEVTESVLALNFDEVVNTMTQLSHMGVQFSLDDFGTGYSSLAYIKSLPLIQLKIDRAFVNDLADNIKGVAIAQTVLSLGQSLNLDVVAEGVETEAQFRQLVGMACPYFQGYWFAKPLPAEAFRAKVCEALAVPSL